MSSEKKRYRIVKNFSLILIKPILLVYNYIFCSDHCFARDERKIVMLRISGRYMSHHNLNHSWGTQIWRIHYPAEFSSMIIALLFFITKRIPLCYNGCRNAERAKRGLERMRAKNTIQISSRIMSLHLLYWMFYFVTHLFSLNGRVHIQTSFSKNRF